MDVSSSCRMCAGITDPGVSLLDPTQQRLAEWVENNLSMTVNPDDGYPTQVCISCVTIIQKWVMFRQRCKKATQMFVKAVRPLEAASHAVASSEVKAHPENLSCEETSLCLNSLTELLELSYSEETTLVPENMSTNFQSSIVTTKTMLDKWLETGKLSQESPKLSLHTSSVSLTKQTNRGNITTIEPSSPISNSTPSTSSDETVPHSDKECIKTFEIPLKNLRVNLTRLVLSQDMLRSIRQQCLVSEQNEETTCLNVSGIRERSPEKEEEYCPPTTSKVLPEFIPVEILEPKSEIKPFIEGDNKFSLNNIISLNYQQKQKFKFKKHKRGYKKTKRHVNQQTKVRTVQQRSCNNFKSEPTSDDSNSEDTGEILPSEQNNSNDLNVHNAQSLLTDSSELSSEEQTSNHSTRSTSPTSNDGNFEDAPSPIGSHTSLQSLDGEPTHPHDDMDSGAAVQSDDGTEDQLTGPQQQDPSTDSSILDSSDSPDDGITPLRNKTSYDGIVSATGAKPSVNKTQNRKNIENISAQKNQSNQSKDKLQCNLCNKLFNKPLNAKMHLKFVHKMQINDVDIKENTKECTMFDDKKYVALESLKEHCIEAHNCNICCKSYKNSQNLKTHIRIVHTAKKIKSIKRKTKTFKCNICHQTLLNKFTLKSHMEIHSEPKYECNLCDKKFTQTAGLYNHNKRFHINGETRYKCYTCSRRFATKHSMIEHSKTHLAPSYKCIPCDRYFKQATGLYHHNKRHHNNGARPFKCDTCPKTFTTRHGITEHKKIHGEAKYCCEICGQKFKQINGLIHHKQGVHAVTRSYMCLKCPATFKTIHGLREHRYVHMSINDGVKCNICKNVYKCKNNLMIHITVAHQNKHKYSCAHCSYVAKLKSYLVKHIKVKHSKIL